MLVNYCWALDLPWSVVNIHSETPFEKTKFFFFCKQVPVAGSFLVRDGDPFPLPLSALSSVNLCRPCERFHSVWVHTCLSPVVVSRHCSLGVIRPLCLSHFCLFFCIAPWAQRGESDEDIPFRTEQKLLLTAVFCCLSSLVAVLWKVRLPESMFALLRFYATLLCCTPISTNHSQL